MPKKARMMEPDRLTVVRGARFSHTQVGEVPVTAERDAEEGTAAIGRIRGLIILGEDLDRQYRVMVVVSGRTLQTGRVESRQKFCHTLA